MTLNNSNELLNSFLTGEERVLLSLEISEFDREIRKQKIRREHPEWCELEVMHEILRQAFRSEPVPEWVERQMQQRLDEYRARHMDDLE
jgi:hypothetical protein